MKYFLALSLIVLFGCTPNKELVDVIQGQNGTNGTNGANGHSLVSEYQAATDLECDSAGGTRLDIYIDMDDSLGVTSGDIYENSIIVCNGQNGLNGADGLPGATGAQGEQGVAGQTGATGATGAQGIQGEPGPQGVAGAAGPQGLVGATGPQGPAGAVGPQGAQGVAGPTGPVGPQGPQGAAGATGATGSSGATITTYNGTSCTLISNTTSYVKVNGSNYSLYTSSSCSGSSKYADISQGESYWASTQDLAIWYSSGLRVVHFNN